MRIAIERALSLILAGVLTLSAGLFVAAQETTTIDFPLAAPVEVAPDKAEYRPTRKLPDIPESKPAKKTLKKPSKAPKALKTEPVKPASVSTPVKPQPQKPDRIPVEAQQAASIPKKAEEKAPPKLSPDNAIAQTLTQSFREDFIAVLQMAQTHLVMTCPKKKDRKHAAAVLDLDETLLDNRAYFVVHKQYDPAKWDQWVQFEEAPAIPETRSLVYWLIQNNFKVFFVSGRKESQRELTVKNLEKIGILPEHYQELYLKADNYDKASAGDFKINARKDIETKGFNIVLVLGDQKSDIIGADGVGFKLPNPVYHIP